MPEFHWYTAKDAEVEACYALRQAVFVEEQGFQDEFDDIDGHAFHLLAAENGEPLATARLFTEEGGWHVGRICVRRQSRGSGLGRVLMDEVERFCREQGGTSLGLSAQLRAAGFYESCGYLREGAEYLDEYCPHVAMKKAL